MRELETLLEQSTTRQAELLRALPGMLEPFPPELLRDRVLPPLRTLLVKVVSGPRGAAACPPTNEPHSRLHVGASQELRPLILPSLLHIAERVSSADFNASVGPVLAPYFALESLRVMKTLVDNTALFVRQGSVAFLRGTFAPLLVRSLDSVEPRMADLALHALPAVCDQLESRVLKGQLVPRLQHFVEKGTHEFVRVSSLQVLVKVSESDVVQGALVPQQPAVGCVCECVQIFKHFEKAYTLDTILPVLQVSRSAGGGACDDMIHCFLTPVASFIHSSHYPNEATLRRCGDGHL